ncbi:LysM peptidoglycan-binding domain-containing protein [Glutamicibacter ardleyensis]
MIRHRRTFIICLLVSACSVVALAVLDWVRSTGPRFEADGDLLQNSLNLFLCAAGICVLTGLLAYATLRIAIFAARRGHTGLLELFCQIAPTLTRRILGSVVGTSLAFASTGLAQAAPSAIAQVSSSQSEELAAFSDDRVAVNAQPNTTVPTPGWLPGSLSIPMNRLMGSGKERNRPVPDKEVVIVASGQTLWSIAQQMLHSDGSSAEIAKLWPQIYEMNREVIGEDPNMLQLGLELKLPVIN